MPDDAKPEGMASHATALAEAVERTAVEMVLERLRAPSDGEARAAQAHAELWLGIVDRVLARVDRYLGLKEAAARVTPPPPTPKEREAKEREAKEREAKEREAGAEQWAEVLEYLIRRPPPSEAAERLRALGVEAEHVPIILADLGAEPEWAAWIDGARSWIDEVTAALGSPAEAGGATCN